MDRQQINKKNKRKKVMVMLLEKLGAESLAVVAKRM
jgi:hypothetical protein